MIAESGAKDGVDLSANDDETESETSEDIQRLDDVTEALIAHSTENLPEQTVLRIVDKFLAGIPEDTDRQLRYVAAEHGLEPTQFAAAAHHIKAALITQAHTCLVDSGIKPEDTQQVFMWGARHFGPAFVSETSKAHYKQGSLTGYKTLAAAWLARNPTRARK